MNTEAGSLTSGIALRIAAGFDTEPSAGDVPTGGRRILFVT